MPELSPDQCEMDANRRGSSDDDAVRLSVVEWYGPTELSNEVNGVVAIGSHDCHSFP